MKFTDKVRVRRAFIDAVNDDKVENGINNNWKHRTMFHAALLAPSFYSEIDRVLEEDDMTLDEYIASIPETWKDGFKFEVPDW